jgi:hypothetical protein
MQRALILGLAAAGLTIAIGTAVAIAQSTDDKTCFWAGEVYQPGEIVTIGGATMVCDGATGTWEKAEEAE